jgi:hypothetical protein
MYDMHAASVAVHNIDYDKRGDRYENMTFWHGFEHNACRKRGSEALTVAVRMHMT